MGRLNLLPAPPPAPSGEKGTGNLRFVQHNLRGCSHWHEKSGCLLSQVLAMRARVQESTAREEEEHPYELLLTAETKKLPAVDRKTKGTTPPPPAETTLKGFVQLLPRGKEVMLFPAAWAGVGVCLPPLHARSKGRVWWGLLWTGQDRPAWWQGLIWGLKS